MPRGGAISIETANTDSTEFRETASGQVQEGLYVRLAVKDTGEGMDEATQARIFEPFFTTKATGVGTGLGLATVYGIVKQSSGHIFVESALGRGTTFRIYLPQVAEPVGAELAPPLMERVEGHETILVVEDQEALREVIRESLGELGYTVLLAESGETALELARRHPDVIHLLLTDVVMPQLSGPDLVPRILSIRPGIKVLFMSGYTSDVLGRQGARDCGIPLVEKPFTSETLARRVREVLS
jgi:CheY-like chemotaxis protein